MIHLNQEFLVRKVASFLQSTPDRAQDIFDAATREVLPDSDGVQSVVC